MQTPSSTAQAAGARPFMTAAQRHAELIRRAWTPAERKVVLRGFWGRAAIAIEPVICSLVFAALTIGLMLRGDLIVLSPIFGLAMAGFLLYAVALMVAPARALLQTRAPIYIVDGYVQYRGPDEACDVDRNGYMAVLLEDGRIAYEWPSKGEVPLPESTRPALVEFSEYGGIHRIDGRPTGVLPETIAPLGVESSLRAKP